MQLCGERLLEFLSKEDTEHPITAVSLECRKQFLARNAENESGERKMKKMKRRRGKGKKKGRGKGGRKKEGGEISLLFFFTGALYYFYARGTV